VLKQREAAEASCQLSRQKKGSFAKGGYYASRTKIPQTCVMLHRLVLGVLLVWIFSFFSFYILD